MSYKNLTTNNKSAIKRFSHAKRFVSALDFAKLKQDDNILDYGSGNGELFVVLGKEQLPKTAVAFEPIDEMMLELQQHLNNNNINGVQTVKDLEILETKFDTIFCLEVLEHFSATNQQAHLQKILGLLKDNGQLIISVPLEVGFASFVKNTTRMLLGQRPAFLTLKNMFKALFYKKIVRKDEPYIYSHIGFNHKELQKEFSDAGLTIVAKTYAPIAILKGFINSQVFYKLKKLN